MGEQRWSAQAWPRPALPPPASDPVSSMRRRRCPRSGWYPAPKGVSGRARSPPHRIPGAFFVFNFLFSVNEKPLGKQPVGPRRLLHEAQAHLLGGGGFYNFAKLASLRLPA